MPLSKANVQAPKVLIIGAGATGQVYGRALLRAGAQVQFLVREKYLASLRAQAVRGFVIYDFSGFSRRRPPRLHRELGFSFIGDVTEAAATEWDYVFLCVSSPAIREAELTACLARLVRGKTKLVSIQAGLEDEEFLLEVIGRDRLISLSVSFMSFEVPLPHDPQTAGLSSGWGVFVPPFPPALLEGDSPGALRDLLIRGGISTRIVLKMRKQIALPDLILNFLVEALREQGWSIRKLTRDPSALRRLSESLQWALKKEGAQISVSPRGLGWLMRPMNLRVLIWLIQKRLPFDLEKMLERHFTKVQAQTQLKMQRYLAN